jgi:hypothetical protein
MRSPPMAPCRCRSARRFLSVRNHGPPLNLERLSEDVAGLVRRGALPVVRVPLFAHVMGVAWQRDHRGAATGANSMCWKRISRTPPLLDALDLEKMSNSDGSHQAETELRGRGVVLSWRRVGAIAALKER